MGEMADMIIDEGIESDFSDSDWPAPEEGTLCMHCRKGPFYWIKTDNGWRLSDGKGKVHSCNEYKRL